MSHFVAGARGRHVHLIAFAAMLALLAGCTAGRAGPPVAMEWVRIGPDGRGFVLEPSRRPFIPWGFNYDHDAAGRLLEEYWETEWSKVAEDFGEMRALGANVVRVHLQFGRFMRGPAEPNDAALERLSRLVTLAEQNGLYLDLTGLGCYLKEEVPAWYDELGEAERWAAQAAFWEAIAACCAKSPAIFCYDLMNEPVVPGGRREPGAWLGPSFAGKYHYVQFITLDQGDRPRPAIAAAWIRTLVAAIRRHDDRHLITVGLVDWSLDRPGLTSGFVPAIVAPELDFLSVHLYPESGRIPEALATLAGFNVGKPVVIEETFPLRCSFEEMRLFLRDAQAHAAGCLSFYWGQTPSEARAAGTIEGAIIAGWVEEFAAARW